jgi:GDPmannose 4,6-dehydratase
VDETIHQTSVSIINLLELLKDFEQPIKMFHASSSEVFGKPDVSPQNENVSFKPVSPYGVAKAMATDLVRVYRDNNKLFLVNGIMFNHESPRRGDGFVSKKICRAAARIAAGYDNELLLGALNVSKDWGHAKDYVQAMWLSLQAKSPSDYIFASGVARPLTEMVKQAFDYAGLDWTEYYRKDEKMIRPSESIGLVGDPLKARTELSWCASYSFEDLIAEMVEFELSNIRVK